MIVIAEMENGGSFEADCKRKLIEKIIQYFCDRDEEAGRINNIYYVFKQDSRDDKKLCDYAVEKIQNIVDCSVEEWRRNVKFECENQKMIEMEYKMEML